MRLAVGGETGPFWVTAKQQTAGRGRLGRHWVSQEGNLLASLLIPMACQPDEVPRLSIVSGLALANAVRSLAPVREKSSLRLKWPNDLMIENAKCAGILVETTTMKRGLFSCVVGFGVNIASAPELQDRQTTSLNRHGWHTDRKELLAALDQAMKQAFVTWTGPNGFANICEAWMSYGPERGALLSVDIDNRPTKGTFAGLADDGAMLIRLESGATSRVTFGDVTAS